MKIVSDFKDSYDRYAFADTDVDLTFNRRKLTAHCTSETLDISKINLSSYFIEDNYTFHVVPIIVRIGFSIKKYLRLFVKKGQYPDKTYMLDINHNNCLANQNVDEILFFINTDKSLKILEEEIKTIVALITYKKVKNIKSDIFRLSRLSLNKYLNCFNNFVLNEEKIHSEKIAPITVFIPETYSDFFTSKLLINPKIGDFGTNIHSEEVTSEFYRNVYLEVRQYLCNSTDLKEVPELNNDDKIINAGFDLKSSFRKGK